MLDHPPNRCSIPVDYPERFPNITLPPIEVKEGSIPVIQGSWTLIPRVVDTPLFAKEDFPSVMSPGGRRSSAKGRNMQREKGETRQAPGWHQHKFDNNKEENTEKKQKEHDY
jgi:hypothetical protein